MKNRIVIGYMDKVDFDHELGAATDGNRVFPSVEALQKHKPCTSQCGIVKVEVRLKEIIQETKFIDKSKRGRRGRT